MISETEKEDIAVANYQDGYLDGMEKGETKHAIETAQRMRKDKVPVETIIKYTGLTEEQVRAL